MSGVDFDREIAQIYRDMELYLIESMQRNLARHLAEEADAGLRYPQWQAEKLKELKRYQRENRQIISSRTRGLSDRVSEHMKAELRQGSKHELKRYKKALGKGYKSAKAMRKSFFKVNDRKISGMINALQNDLGAANTAVLRMMNDTYRQTIFRAGMYASNGVMTETQAYDMAVKDFLERGINCIEYRDGRRVNIADYASMAVRTANQRAYMVGEGEFRKSIGETLVIISHHATACKLCRPFERKVLIDDVYSGGKPGDGDYMLLSEAMKLGLFHPRCRHGLGTYYPELEDINRYNNEENDVSDYGRYNRAHIENMVQRYKRLTAGSVDPENVARYQAKLREWERKKEALDNLAKPLDITENGKYEVLPYDNETDYKAAIREEYLNQNISSEDNATIWAKDGGYIQNSVGYSEINSWLRGLSEEPPEGKYQKTMRILERLTRSFKLRKNYVGFRKVNCEYLQNVMGIDIRGLVKKTWLDNGMGRKRPVFVPKDKQSAQAIVDQINKRIITGSFEITDKAFTSISMCEKVNYFTHYPVQFEIQMPIGTRGMITNNWAESEFITKPNTVLEFLGSKVYNKNGISCIKIYAKMIQR
nr:MAG TPA: minor capsid protein [Caudoviricetes sp.]